MTSVAAAAAQGVITPDEALTLSQLVALSRCPRVEAQAPRRDVSILRVSRRSRERDRVADFGEAGEIGEGAPEGEENAARGAVRWIAVTGNPGQCLHIGFSAGDGRVAERLKALR
jgi:hypothetical protein